MHFVLAHVLPEKLSRRSPIVRFLHSKHA